MKAYYLDGKSSQKRQCKLSFLATTIQITFWDASLKEDHVYWDIAQIEKITRTTTSKTLRYGEFPKQVLEFSSNLALNAVIDNYPDAAFHKSHYNSFAKFGWKAIFGGLLTLMLVLAFFLVYAAPFIADNFAKLIPMEYEAYIGEQFKESYLEYMDVDTVKSADLQSYYDQLAYQSPYDIKLSFVQSDIVNAFALPGGNIVVFSGIVDVMNSPDELSALLAHETIHINKRHSLRTISNELSTYLLFASLTGDLGGFSSVLIENSQMLNSMSFSRDFEKEADLEGVALMKDAGVDPKGMIELFEHFKVGKDSLIDVTIDTDEIATMLSEKLPELLATHPKPSNRIQYLQECFDGIAQDHLFVENDSLIVYFSRLKNN